MQQAGKTSETGYSCFAMNIKGGRGFPGISLHNPIKLSDCLILDQWQTAGARSLCCGRMGRNWIGVTGCKSVGECKCEGNREVIVRGEWIERSRMNCLCIGDRDPTGYGRVHLLSFLLFIFFLSSDKMKLDSLLPSPWPPPSLCLTRFL